MLGLLASAGTSLLKNFLPSAISWGVNKLVNSRMGKSYITPNLMGKVQGIVNQVNGAIEQNGTQQVPTSLLPLAINAAPKVVDVKDKTYVQAAVPQQGDKYEPQYVDVEQQQTQRPVVKNKRPIKKYRRPVRTRR